MSIILITSYYQTENSERNSEINDVLHRNLLSRIFEKVILFCDPKSQPDISHESLEIFEFIERPKYSDFFHSGNQYEGKYIVIANSDIFFDETLHESIDLLKNARILALTRYEYDTETGTSVMEMGSDSQDSWIYKSPINVSGINTSFNLGIPGCDNRIAHELSLKHKVINPSLRIKTYHIHGSNYRTYDTEKRLDGPYLQINIE